jgi:hypothetical protein
MRRSIAEMTFFFEIEGETRARVLRFQRDRGRKLILVTRVNWRVNCDIPFIRINPAVIYIERQWVISEFHILK